MPEHTPTGPRRDGVTVPALVRGKTPLDDLEISLRLLCTGPKPLAVNGRRLGHGLPRRMIPLHELASVLMHPATGFQAREAAWRLLVTNARTGDEKWIVGAVGVALPGLRRAAGRLARATSRAMRWVHQAIRLVPVLTVAAVTAAVLLGDGSAARAAQPGPATVLAADSVEVVVNNIRGWLVTLLAAVATLFLTIGGLRLMWANGDPGEAEKGKAALKSAAIGYALALLSPLIVTVVAGWVK
jgi:hypothetical protein